jgi:topoisomerase IA-like protein
VSGGETNARLCKGGEVETIALECAYELLAEMWARGPVPRERVAAGVSGGHGDVSLDWCQDS